METRPLPLGIADHRHDYLTSLADEIHRTYFYKMPALSVRWGQQITRKKRRSIRLGSYNHITTEIRIHPLLNSSDTPAFFIQSVIYHEYLHHVLGAKHNRRFHAHERQFRYYREAQEWIRRNLLHLLGTKRKNVTPVVARVEQPQMALF